MKSLTTITIWVITCVCAALMSTAVHQAAVRKVTSVTSHPENQFLEIVNNSWRRLDTYVFLIEDERTHDRLSAADPSQRTAIVEDSDLLTKTSRWVVPDDRQSVRIADVLKPGYSSLFVYSLRSQESMLTSRFEVGNHGENTFLYGKCLTINPNLANEYKLEAVQIFHGEWLLRWHEESGQYTEMQMKLMHLSGRPDIEGEIRNPEGHLVVRGETKGRSMVLAIRQGQMALFTWALTINDQGNWVGEGRMEWGDGAQGPVTLDMDYEKKTIDYYDHEREWQ